MMFPAKDCHTYERHEKRNVSIFSSAEGSPKSPLMTPSVSSEGKDEDDGRGLADSDDDDGADLTALHVQVS